MGNQIIYRILSKQIKMNLAYPSQKIQDWFTQQWVIIRGKKINKTDENWLEGPFGNLNGIREDFIYQLAEKKRLIILRNHSNQGLLNSFKDLKLPKDELDIISKEIVAFYENTSNYELHFKVNWNPFFRFFGKLVQVLFSKRINQLNLPLKNSYEKETLKSEIIQLLDPETKQIKYTIWLRKTIDSNVVVYSGVYGTCKLPDGKTCVKAIFPLPKGNATVILNPIVTQDGKFILESKGKKFGEAGFYFLLVDSKGQNWAQYIKSFRDCLLIKENNTDIEAIQTLSLWNFKVLELEYKIKKKINI